MAEKHFTNISMPLCSDTTDADADADAPLGRADIYIFEYFNLCQFPCKRRVSPKQFRTISLKELNFVQVKFVILKFVILKGLPTSVIVSGEV